MKKINILFSTLVVTLLLIGAVSAMNVNIIPADEVIGGSGTNTVYYDDCDDVPQGDYRRSHYITCTIRDVPGWTPTIQMGIVPPYNNYHINITKETEEEIAETEEESIVVYSTVIAEEITEIEEENAIITSEAEQENEEETTIVGEKQIVTITEESVVIAEEIPETEEEISGGLIQKIIDFFKKVLG